MNKYIRWFNQISMQDIALVGGKNASIGQLITCLKGNERVKVPNGFAITTHAYRDFLKENDLEARIVEYLKKLDIRNVDQLHKTAASIRNTIEGGAFSALLSQEITQAYDQLITNQHTHVAVRSSASAEDLPGASFAGQQETFLHVHGHEMLLDACKKAMGSLFTPRAIVYRVEKGFDHLQVAISIGVQLMVHADTGVSGVAFSIDTESGNQNVVLIEAAYGLGELVVQGEINPDSYYVAKKPLADTKKLPIIRKELGSKEYRMMYQTEPSEDTKTTHKVSVPRDLQQQFALRDQEIVDLARATALIERYYSSLYKQWMPMDIEWALDGNTRELYIVQARPETVQSQQREVVWYQWSINQKGYEQLAQGIAIGSSIVSGRAKIVKSLDDAATIQEGDILITYATNPDWVPVMQKVAGVVTQRGGRTCHAAIVSRELGKTAIIGVDDVFEHIHDNEIITLDCSSGMVGKIYRGAVSYTKQEIKIGALPKSPVPLYINIGQPTRAFSAAQLPVDGVGLARLEFIIANEIGIHPLAALHPEKADAKTRAIIESRSSAYASPREYYVQKLAQGIATIAAAFYPRPVTVRFSDFKSSEYRALLGGAQWETLEENPMLGIRGAIRYYIEPFNELFTLEVEAFKHVLHTIGLDNIVAMVPFVRTVKEAHIIDGLCTRHEFSRSVCKRIMMVEIPSNIIQLAEFAAYYDGFSIGSNDLTQLVLGVDRDNPVLSQYFDERDPAVKAFVAQAIETAKKCKKPISICGQAPSDFPEFADFLIAKQIDAMSLSIDAIIPFLLRKK